MDPVLLAHVAAQQLSGALLATLWAGGLLWMALRADATPTWRAWTAGSLALPLVLATLVLVQAVRYGISGFWVWQLDPGWLRGAEWLAIAALVVAGRPLHRFDRTAWSAVPLLLVLAEGVVALPAVLVIAATGVLEPGRRLRAPLLIALLLLCGRGLLERVLDDHLWILLYELSLGWSDGATYATGLAAGILGLGGWGAIVAWTHGRRPRPRRSRTRTEATT